MSKDIQRNVIFMLRDLHARESMRLGWYRQWRIADATLQHLRERKANHQAFLHQLLRHRDQTPAWYARLFYYFGHLSGFVTAVLPDFWELWIEKTLEFWILERYRKYLHRLTLDKDIRTMVEAVQLHKLKHNEPGGDILLMIQKIIRDSEEFQTLTSRS